ncbi:aminotransferase class V-fold PLP-dependent enzyme [Kiloniella laminariae]|uniref:aminotransferase class V-fold PLP-dependent enzyme n=1 Tax=Kiloniella laminariae TaxID=454162 RepID=UPI00036FCB9A|nr:aminotransferase class V-fold PLP-dependent enzyme [Kiloniella laminariae]
MAGRNSLFIPGPTNMPERVRLAMDIYTEDHRAGSAPEFMMPLFEDLKKVFRTKSGEIIVFPSSGTGGWEAAITNTLSPGDKVLTARIGQFSSLWVDSCRALGIVVEDIDVEWGEGVPVDLIAERLAADKQHEIKGVIVCHNETATGVTSDIKGVRQAMDACNHPALLYVDGISSIGAIEFEMDAWGVDLAVAGSQKGFMLPAGLGLVGVSQKALEAGKTATCPRFYFDFRMMINQNRTGYGPYTPAMGLLRGLRASTDMLLEEGMENVWNRHHHLAEGVRRAVRAWGLKTCAQKAQWQSDTVTAIMVPEQINGQELIKRAYNDFNLSLGAGLARMAGKLFRIGHLGDLNECMLFSALGGAEMVMRDMGMAIEPGKGVGAAVEYWRKNS